MFRKQIYNCLKQKLAHVHFASNEDAEERLIKLAEEKFRVFNTGAPQVDEMVQTPLLDP